MKKTIFSIGVGWFALQAIWTTYNAFMPLLYAKLTEAPDASGKMVPNLFLVGLLMTTDNFLGLAIGPFWGARSDQTRSKFGRRMPYILIGMPLAAIFTFILPFFAQVSLMALVGAALLMNFSMTIFRAPLVSFFSDLFPKSMRSQVSGTTDLMAGIGAIVALLGGGELYRINPSYPFIMVSLTLIIAALVMRVGVKEPDVAEISKHEDVSGDLPPTIVAAIRTLIQLPQRSPILFLIGVMFTWSAWNAIESFWTTFATTALKMNGGDAANFAAILALSYLVGAVPAGIAAAKWGRQRTIMIGIVLLIPLYVIGAFNTSSLAFAILLGVMGPCWALVLVNGVVLFQEFASLRQIGLFSGIYAIATAISQIIGPPLYGYLMDVGGPHMLWYVGIGALILGAFFVSRVSEGRINATA